VVRGRPDCGPSRWWKTARADRPATPPRPGAPGGDSPGGGVLLRKSRLCAGGPACLFAIARPEGDYALPIQRRSRQVVNVAGRMAVVPKAFHQSISDTTTEARVGATIWRELEEELLGRQELEQLVASSRRCAAPDHPRNRTEPVAWLHENPCSRLECTGFGINLVSGNYEVACLLTIDDERWWETFGDRVQANWEAMDLHCYSSRDPPGLTRLVADSTWSNEGLFALIEGLRRLDALHSARVDMRLSEIS